MDTNILDGPIWLLARAFVGGILATIIHEAGHAVAGWLLKLSPRVISIGQGPMIWRASLWGATLILRAYPVGGYVHLLPAQSRQTGREALLDLGGVIGNSVAAIVLIALRQASPGNTSFLDIWIFIQEVFVVINLIPVSVKIRHPKPAVFRSDGARLLRLFTHPGLEQDAVNKCYRSILALTGLPVEEPVIASIDAPELIFEMLRPGVGTAAWTKQDHYGVMKTLLDRRRLSPLERRFVLEYLIESELLYRDTELSAAELEALSKESISLFDNDIRAYVKRGGVLILLNRIAEGEAILLPLVDQPPPQAEISWISAFLAQAASARGDRASTQQWIEKARAAIPPEEAAQFTPTLDRLIAGL